MFHTLALGNSSQSRRQASQVGATQSGNPSQPALARNLGANAARPTIPQGAVSLQHLFVNGLQPRLLEKSPFPRWHHPKLTRFKASIMAQDSDEAVQHSTIFAPSVLLPCFPRRLAATRSQDLTHSVQPGPNPHVHLALCEMYVVDA